MNTAHCPGCGAEVTVVRRRFPRPADPDHHETVVWCPACEVVLAPDALDVRGPLCAVSAEDAAC